MEENTQGEKKAQNEEGKNSEETLSLKSEPEETVVETVTTGASLEKEDTSVSTEAEVFDEQDLEENKVFAIMAYISILCLVPLFLKKDSRFAYFHARQGLVVLIFTVLAVISIEILKAISPYTLWRIWNLVGNLTWLAIIIFSVIGVAHVLQNKNEQLPFIGHLADEVVKKLNL